MAIDYWLVFFVLPINTAVSIQGASKPPEPQGGRIHAYPCKAVTKKITSFKVLEAKEQQVSLEVPCTPTPDQESKTQL